MISHGDVSAELHVALQALQHRGQDSAGIATMTAKGDEFHMRRALGMVAQALGPDDIGHLTGSAGIGHVRYPTIGRGVLADAQPFFYRRPGVIMAHNGNITNYTELRESLAERSIHLLSHCDVEPALCEFADALMERRRSRHTFDDAIHALREVQRRVRGSYSIAATLMLDGQPTMLLLRDPNGIRPAVIGKRSDGSWLVASESITLDALGFERVTDPKPGEVVFLRAGQDPIRMDLDAREPAPCVFEYIYFARPDSVIDGRSVYEVRLGLGRSLARRIQQKGIKADVVIPAGRWTVGIGSDDGGQLTIPGVLFDVWNANDSFDDDQIRFENNRGHGWTVGAFELAEPLETTITASFHERGGGDSIHKEDWRKRVDDRCIG